VERIPGLVPPNRLRRACGTPDRLRGSGHRVGAVFPWLVRKLIRAPSGMSGCLGYGRATLDQQRGTLRGGRSSQETAPLPCGPEIEALVPTTFGLIASGNPGSRLQPWRVSGDEDCSGHG